MKSRLTALAAILVAGVLASASAATDYEIRFQRPVAVGDTYHASGTGSDEQSMFLNVDGQTVRKQEDKYSVVYEADYEVLALTTTGRASKARLTIQKLVRTAADGTTTELVPAGTVLTAEHVGRRTAFKDGENPVAPLVSASLATLGVNMATDQQVGDDQVFGSKERKKVGDSWAINTELAAADLSKLGVPATAENLTGTTTLAEVVQAEGGPALRLNAAMDIKGVNPPLPPGVEVQSSVFKTTMTGLFPLDATKRVLQEGTAMQMEIKAGGVRDGRTLEMSMTKKTSRETEFTRN